MEQTLLNRHMEMISLRKLVISLSCFWNDPEFAALVDRCVCFAIGNDQMIENLFARCLLIEYLTIESSKGFKSLELFGLNKLHEVNVFIVPREWRQILHPPLRGVKHLNLKIDGDLLDFRIPELGDGLLWLSPHIETISMSFHLVYSHKYSFQFLYKEQLTHEGETPSCCQSLPFSCWENCLKGVKIEHTWTSTSPPAYLDRFSFEKKTLEKHTYVERFYFHDKIWDKLNHLYLNLRKTYSYLFYVDI
ncbi:hypothetical protein Pint_19728 [Pistacia integerrima]|uniref:Uncharacterized protein n=1 Tax=Pistacia integerrima TaxID=434235 RepID=A0ACC0XA30_9ROSI|nr:hypothetical protein Pint_19728 [Pistacia integerrima]